MKTQIYIEGNRLDLFDDEQITIRSNVQDVNDISKLYADFSQSFTVPASDNNNGIFSHYYNADIDGGYDARTRKQSTIDIDTLDFKRGKMRLDEVVIKNGQPAHYKITFFGDVIKVKDLLGDDELTALSWLSNFDHSFNATNVKTGLTTGLDFTVSSTTYEEAVIYPLIAYQRQYMYNSDSSDTTATTELVNIAYDAGRTDGVNYTELKPAIKLSLIVEAIEQKYDLNFTGDFFDSAEFEGIYMNLNKTTESLAAGLKVYEDYSSTYSGIIGGFATDGLYRTTVVPAAGFTTTKYKIRLSVNDTVVYESTNWLTRTQTKRGDISFTTSVSDGEDYTLKAEIITEEDFTFDATTEFKVAKFFVEYPQTTGSPYTSQSIVLTAAILNEIPDIKVIDFLTSLFKMFNLVITPDGENINVQDLPTWYTEGEIHDVTQYVDTETQTVKRGRIFSEINFLFEESDQILADEFRQSNNQGYGDLEFKLVDSSGTPLTDVDGERLDIEVEFENPIYERLFDLNTNAETVIQYCPYFDRNINPISGNPFLFYAPSVSVLADPIGYLGSSYEEINTSIYMPSHSRQIDTSSFNLNFNAELNEYTSSLFEDTIYKRYYEDYITDMFSIKRRIYDITAILPNSLLNTLELNDRLIIKDTRYIINSISSNLVTRKDTLELINDIYDAPLQSDVLSSSLWTPDQKSYNSQPYSDSSKYVGLSGKTISKVDTGDGTSWLTVVESTTATNVQTVNYSITANLTGMSRTVQIQVTDGINDPKFTIGQNTLTNATLNFGNPNNALLMNTIIGGRA